MTNDLNYQPSCVIYSLQLAHFSDLIRTDLKGKAATQQQQILFFSTRIDQPQFAFLKSFIAWVNSHIIQYFPCRK